MNTPTPPRPVAILDTLNRRGVHPEPADLDRINRLCQIIPGTPAFIRSAVNVIHHSILRRESAAKVER